MVHVTNVANKLRRIVLSPAKYILYQGLEIS